MDETTVLLNGGRTLDVTPVDGADQVLTQLLGAAPSRPAIPILRLIDGPAGARWVGVFIGNTHVGYLLDDVDEGLVAALQACELHGAVARARGTLMASWEEPEIAMLKVDLAQSDQLLTEPSPHSPVPHAPEVERQAEPSPSATQAWTESAAPTAQPADLVDQEPVPGISAGLAEDYPDWPPRRPQVPPALGTAPVPAESLASPESSAPTEASPAEPFDPPTAPSTAAPTASPQAPLSTRSAWLGAIPMPGAAPQAGWLGASRPRSATEQSGLSEQSASLEQSAPRGETGWLGAQQSGADGAIGGVALPPTGEGDSWQDRADRPRDPESQFVTGWTTGPAQAQPIAEVKSRGLPDRTKAWLVSVLAVVVLATAGFLVWKTVFAPKTYTDDQYGYSFSYPGRWEFEDESGMPSFASLAMGGAEDYLLDFAMAGHGDSQENVAALGVCVFDASTLLWDPYQMQAEMEANLALAVSQDPTIAVLEPVYAATLGGVPGCRFTISASSIGYTVNVTFYILVDNGLGYLLLGLAPEPSWPDNKGAFEDFFKSFKPGTTKV